MAPGDASLFQPCKCPRMVHPLCLARWQLRSAGRDEEKQCRFCHYCLPDWRISIQTRAAQDVRRCGVRAPATMTVAFCGKVIQNYSLRTPVCDSTSSVFLVH